MTAFRRDGLLLLVLLVVVTASAAVTPRSALAAACQPQGSVIGTTTWNGMGDGTTWQDSRNWSNGIPGRGNCSGTIPAGASVVLDGSGGAASLTLNGTLVVEGSTNPNGTSLDGSFSAPTTIGPQGALHMTATSSLPAGVTNVTPNPGQADVDGTIVNSGLISVDTGATGPNTGNVLTISLTNNASATVAIHTDVSSCGCAAGGSWTNNGTISVDTGTTTFLSRTGAGYVFDQAGGTVANAGRLIVSGTMTHDGGTTTGNPIQVCGNLDAHDPSTASFEIINDSSFCGGGAITNDIGSGDSVTVLNSVPAPSQLLVGTTSFTNHGTLSMDGAPGNTGDKYLTGGSTVTNDGIMNFDANGRTELQTTLVNNATVNVAAGATLSLTAGPLPLTQNSGTFTIGAGATVGAGSTVTLAGGTLANSGTFSTQDFTHSGGSTTGTSIQVCGSLSAPGPGTASFEMRGVCGSPAIVSDIGAGDTVQIQSTTQTMDVSTGSFTNHGVLSIDSAVGNPVQLHGTTLTNQGTLDFAGSGTNMLTQLANSGDVSLGAGSAASFNSAVSQSGGSMTLGDTSVLNLTSPLALSGGTLGGTGTVGGDLTSGALVRPGTAGGPVGVLSVTGAYTQQAAGVLATRVAGAGSDRLAVTGAATLDGRLDLATVGAAPPEGQTYQVVTDASQAGHFATVTGQGYSVVYDPTDVRLVALKPPPPVSPPPTATTPTTTPSGPGSALPATLISVFPGSGPPTGNITLTLRGAGLVSASTVTLTRPGTPSIAATGVQASADGRALTATVDLSGARLGARDIVVSSNGAQATLPGVFQVVSTRQPIIDAQIVGPGTALGDFLWTGELQYSNTGNVDAHNTLIRLDGFERGSDVRVIGPGVSTTDVDSPDGHSVIVAVDRIPAGSTGTALVRFTPVGPPHSNYALDTSVLQDDAPASGPTGAGPIQASNEIRSSTPSQVTGVLHLSGAFGAGDVTYDLTRSPAAALSGPTLAYTDQGANARIDLGLTSLPAASGPPPPAGSRSTRSPVALAATVRTAQPRRAPLTAEHITASYTAAKKLVDNISLYNDIKAIHAFELSRHQLDSCLRNKHIITRAQYYTLERWAQAGETISYLNKAVGKSAADAASLGEVSVEFGLLAQVGTQGWESTLVGSGLTHGYGFLNETGDSAGAAGNPHEPFQGLTPAERLQLVAKICFPPRIRRRHYLQVIRSGDPNGKDGPSGYGTGHYIAAGSTLPYSVHFENLATATAPAHEVRITDQLDPTKVDLSSLSLGAVYFGDTVLTPPAALQTWSTTVDLRPAKNLIVAVAADLNRQTGLLTWDFRGLDPATGQPQTDPVNGFLPPNTTSPAGQGGVSFGINQVPGLRTNAKIANAATIVFDRNAPIATPTYVNTIDSSAPSSRVRSVKRRGRSCALAVRWSGHDSGAGIAFYDVYVARGQGRFVLWRFHTARRAATYTAAKHGIYRFRTIATDGSGHIESGRLRAKRVMDRC